MRSVVILGKGASVKRSTAAYIDSFDEVAICNNPVYKGYEHLISNHADYHFKTNMNDSEVRSIKMFEDLGVKFTIHTGAGSWLRNHFRFKDLDPSTGTLAFSYFLSNPNYRRIALVGFDLFAQGSRVYYFEPGEIDAGMKYLFDNGTYTRDGFISNIKSGHQDFLTAEYMTLCFLRFQNINFEIITDYPFEYRGKNIKFL